MGLLEKRTVRWCLPDCVCLSVFGVGLTFWWKALRVVCRSLFRLFRTRFLPSLVSSPTPSVPFSWLVHTLVSFTPRALLGTAWVCPVGLQSDTLDPSWQLACRKFVSGQLSRFPHGLASIPSLPTSCTHCKQEPLAPTLCHLKPSKLLAFATCFKVCLAVQLCTLPTWLGRTGSPRPVLFAIECIGSVFCECVPAPS